MKKGTVYSNKAIFVEDFDRHQKIELKFKIEKVLFQKDTFAIVNVDVTWNDKRVLFPQNRTTILGSFLDPRIGDVFTGTGIIQHDKRYGYSVKLKTTPQVYTPRTKVEIVDFLSSQIDGIGKIKAERIFDYFGEDTIQILQGNPELVKKVGVPITSKTMECIKSRLVDGGVLNKIFTVLNLMQLRENLAIKIYDKYGAKSYDELLANPYIIAEVSPLHWRAADEFYYRQLKENKDLPSLLDFSANPLRFRTAIKYFLKLKVELSGSLAYPLKELQDNFLDTKFWERMSRFGSQGARLTKTQLTILLGELEKEGEIYQTKSKTSGEYYLYLQNSFLAETNIVQLIKSFNRNSYSKSSEDDVHEFIEEYQEKYANDLKKDLARIPIVKNKERDVEVGKALMDLHLNYEEIPVYNEVDVTPLVNPSYKVTKMRFDKKRDENGKSVNDLSAIIFNSDITISNIPEKAYEYVVNGRSAIEWIIDQYQVKTDRKSGITDDPNDYSDDEKYIFNLLLRIINVSVQTVDLINSLPKFEVED